METLPPFVHQITAQRYVRNRLGMAAMNGVLVGKGSARAVYDLKNGTVLKVAINRKGIAQNKNEADPRFVPYYGDLLAEVKAVCPKGYWLIQRKAEAILANMTHEPSGKPRLPSHRLDALASFHRRIGLVCHLLNLTVLDAIAPVNIGVIDQRFQLVDFGTTPEIFMRYYSS